MTTYIITGTFNSTAEMVEHLQSQDHPVTVMGKPNIEAAADGLLGYEIRAILRHNWTEEGIDHIERAIAQRAVAAALTPSSGGSINE